MKHRHVFKTCGPDGQWVTGPQGQSLRDATQCEQDDEDLKAQVGRPGQQGCGVPACPPSAPVLTCSLLFQEKFGNTYDSFKVMYTVGYSVSVCALLLALALLLGFRWEFGHGCPQGGQVEAGGPCTSIDSGPQIRSKLHCMRNYIHMNLFASFILKGVSVLVIDALLHTYYSDKIDGYSVQVWLSDEVSTALAGTGTGRASGAGGWLVWGTGDTAV